MLLGSQSCHLSSNTNANVPPLGVRGLQYSGMTYLIVSTPQGVTLANVTKDSLEVLLRRRNEKYLEIANRPFKHLQK